MLLYSLTFARKFATTVVLATLNGAVPVATVLTNCPAVVKLPPVMFAADVMVLVADINPPVSTLPAVRLPVIELNPALIKLPEYKLPVADINPPVKMLPPVTFAVTLTTEPK